MSAISKNLPTPPDNFSTQLSAGISDSDLTIPLNSVSGLSEDEGIGVLFKKDSDGEIVAGSIEFVHWTGISGSSLTLDDTDDRGITGSDSGAQAYSTGDYFEVWVTKYYYDSQKLGFEVEHNQDGSHKWDDAGMGFPRGFLINGKIVVTDAVGITVAIKTLAGNDPSASDPVYCRIGDTVRKITAALSVAKADGTNWCNAGSSELATYEIDYFVYLGYNSTDGVVIGFSRFPGANEYDDFSATSTNEKYCAISTITNAAAGDDYEVIGRFAATLSAGAGYTWSVPTFTNKNLIQRPIYETRELKVGANETGFSVLPNTEYNYKIIGSRCFCEPLRIGNETSNSTDFSFLLPFTPKNSIAGICGYPCFIKDNSTNLTNLGYFAYGASNVASVNKTWYAGNFTSSNLKAAYISSFNYEI